MPKLLKAILCLLFPVLFAASGYAQGPLVDIKHVEFDTGRAATTHARIKATLYLPVQKTRVPAMIVSSSSGGVQDSIEGYYSRKLNEAGIASLVIDSFEPRGIVKTVEDQSSVSTWDMEIDAFAGLAYLSRIPSIDPSRIGIMGLSKGGVVAMNSAISIRQRWRKSGSLNFAIHAPIAPNCANQHRTIRTTGKPIFFMLGELDDYNIAKHCVDYADRIRKAGNQNVTTKVYEGANHAWEQLGAVVFLPRAENHSGCMALIEDNGATTALPAGPTLKASAEIFAWRRSHCIIKGAHVGGGLQKLKDEAAADLIGFLKQNGF